MTGIPTDRLATLDDAIRGGVFAPETDGFDEARRLWNARASGRPAAVVRPSGTADVLEAVRFADAVDRPVTAKGGGHHVAGIAIGDGAIALDFGDMDGVRVDPSLERVHVGPGATWGQVDHETQAFGMAVPGGQDPNIGVAGLTLGGGVGWLSRRYGLTCDALVGADVVTAAGRLRRASDADNPDLFWGLRGGGGALGVVTSFSFDLHDLGTSVIAGSLMFPHEELARVLEHYRWAMAEAPRALRLMAGSMVLPDSDYYPPTIRGRRAAMLIGCYAGDPDDGRRALRPLRERATPALDSFRERSYLGWQRAGTSVGRRRTHVRSQYVASITAPVVDALVEAAAHAPTDGATVFVSPRGGAEADPAPTATAFPHRTEAHHVLAEARWDGPALDAEHVAWTEAVAERLAPHTTGEVAFNFLTADEPPERVRAAFGPNYGRLVDLKTTWDPANRLRMNPFIEARR
ncbi:MAG: FAD-binding oxidoreductase [Halobacteriales archaeon]